MSLNITRAIELQWIYPKLELVPNNQEDPTYYRAFWNKNLIGTVYGDGSNGAHTNGEPTVIMVEIAPRLTGLEKDAYRSLVEDLNSLLG